MRWPSSRSNRAREEIATTRQFSRLSAMPRFPFDQALQQGEIQRHFNTPCLQAAHQSRVTIQLRRVTLALLFQERIHVGTAMPAGLVIHYPAHTRIVHEGAIDDTGLETAVLHQAEGVLAPRFRVLRAASARAHPRAC